ncbi:hypothetical protein [Salinilacihabitans rarus]|uniref:hypothetical protein n=1 Tax=Salinilacihabitans rarus TaxID=2961596 RepID=UPI0020C928EC|nr:hypothetical protein [Salinilacihabitans rarus]
MATDSSPPIADDGSTVAAIVLSVAVSALLLIVFPETGFGMLLVPLVAVLALYLLWRLVEAVERLNETTARIERRLDELDE